MAKEAARSQSRQRGTRHTIEVSDALHLVISEHKKELESWMTPDARGKVRRISMDQALKSMLSHRQPGGFEQMLNHARDMRSRRVADLMGDRKPAKKRGE
jgi:hypothetical protein